MLETLITILIIAGIAYLVYYIVERFLPLPIGVKQIIGIIIGLIALVKILEVLGVHF